MLLVRLTITGKLGLGLCFSGIAHVKVPWTIKAFTDIRGGIEPEVQPQAVIIRWKPEHGCCPAIQYQLVLGFMNAARGEAACYGCSM